MNDVVRNELLRVARAQEITSYSVIAPVAGINLDTDAGRAVLARLLGEISTAEHAAGRPLLSAVVVLKGSDVPGRGFFTLARDLGRFAGGDDMKFWVEEVKRVWDYWMTHP